MAIKEYELRSGDVEAEYKTANRRMAFKLFLSEVIKADLIGRIGVVMIARDVEEGEEYPMRTSPALYDAGLITREQAVRGISKAIGETEYEVDKDLDDIVEQDEWLADALPAE